MRGLQRDYKEYPVSEHGQGTGPGPTEVVLGIALCPSLNPPHLPLAISKARDVVAGGRSKGKGTGPGPTEVVLGVALFPSHQPPPPLAISKARIKDQGIRGEIQEAQVRMDS